MLAWAAFLWTGIWDSLALINVSIIVEYQVQLSAEPNTNQFDVQTERGAKALRPRPSYLIVDH